MKQELTSNCCGAAVLDNWLCSDCKEHCTTIVSETVSVWVLDQRFNRVQRLLLPILYELEDWDSGYEVEEFLADYYDHSDFSWMMSDKKEIDFEDLDLT